MMNKRTPQSRLPIWDAFLTRTYGNKALFTIEETRRILGCSRQTVRERIDSGQLDIRYIGSSRRITRAALITYLSNGRARKPGRKAKKRKGDTMSFVNVLFEGKDVSGDEIAAEIVILEKVLPSLEANANATAQAAKRLRQRKLGGKSVKAEEIVEAEAEKREAKKDLETAQATIQELKPILVKKAQAEQHAKIEELKQFAEAKWQERHVRRAELIKEFAPFFLKWREVEGGHSGEYYFELNGRGAADPNIKRAWVEETERLIGGELPFSPGFVGEAREATRKAEKLARANKEQCAEALLQEARAQAAEKEKAEKGKTRKQKDEKETGK